MGSTIIQFQIDITVKKTENPVAIPFGASIIEG